MRWTLTVYVLFLSLGDMTVNGHGFAGSTYVRMPSGYFESIEQIVEQAEAMSVMSYHCDTRQCRPHKILARASSVTNCYYAFNLDNGPSDDIVCSPLQVFYLSEKNCWAPAHALQVGDVLITAYEGNLPITCLRLVEQQIDIYALKIECPHTFLVGRHSVLTHNMNLPIASLCWELPLTITTLSTFGGLFTGCMAAASGVAVGAIAASLLYSAIKDHKAKHYHEVQIPKESIALLAQKQNNAPKIPQGGRSNLNQPEKPNDQKPRSTDKVGNMYELFAFNEFGQKLEEYSEPTRGHFKGAKIYRMVCDLLKYGLKKGYYFYLDTLHHSHIEVFSESGKYPIGVLNLDGTNNVSQTAKAISIGRDIVDHIR